MRDSRTIDLRTGLPHKRGQAGAASSKATLARTDKVIRREMREVRQRWKTVRAFWAFFPNSRCRS